MNTWRESILAAVMARLVAAGVAGGHVYRSRTEALTRDELPAVVVRPGGETVDNANRQLAIRRFEVLIDTHARSTPTVTADQAADPVIASIHLALMAEQTLGGVIARLAEEETVAPELVDADESAVLIQTRYTAIYSTPAADNTRPA
jgi:hypothetical protein